MASQTEKAFGGFFDPLNKSLAGQANINTSIEDPEDLEDPTAGQAITQAINTVPSMVKSGVEGVAGLGKKVYEDPNILVKGAETVANIIWNPKDVPFLAAIKSRLLRSTGNFDHVFETNSKTGEIENKVKEIEKPLDDFFALKKEQYGENFLTTLSNEPEIIFSDLLNFTGLGAAGKNAIDSLIPDAKTLKALMTPEPEPKLVPVTANADSTPGSLAEQTESLMPTVRKTFTGSNPPTYNPRSEPFVYSPDGPPQEYLDLLNTNFIIFREPILEFAETVSIPKKGLLGSEFLTLIKKNDSIPETSLQEGIIDPQKRYTKEELLDTLGYSKIVKSTFSSFADISPEKIKQFESNQRQDIGAGFIGGEELEYFDIPINTSIGSPGRKFKGTDQHYKDNSIVHVRGSIIDPQDIEDTDFLLAIKGENYLLVEEIQSDLLTKGFVKPVSNTEKNFEVDLNSYYGLPPIRKNKQAVDEALKLLIAKAAQSEVNYIVIPPAGKIAEARGRTLSEDKGDRFYRTYVTDLEKSLRELAANYPVKIMDAELPYKSQIPDFVPDILKDTINTETDKMGIIIDISELITNYKVEKPRQFAQGGLTMNEQTEMAFMQQGGLKDDGMKRDPVSGNPVPNGSMAEEVRDDIPAQLSEGEYVVPADVVRYYGVKHFEDIRNKAKSGLQSMEANGRIGGEPVPVGGPKAGMQQPSTPYNTVPTQPQQQMSGGLNQGEMNEIQSMMMAVGGFVEEPNNMQQGNTDPYQQQQTMYKQPMAMGAFNGTDVSGLNFTPGSVGPTVVDGSFSTKPTPAIVDKTVQTAVTLYSPDGLIVKIVNLPDQQMEHDNLIAQGYTITKPTVTQGSSGGRKGGSGGTPGGSSPAVDEDYGKDVDWSKPNEYANKIYNDLDNIEGAAKTVAGGAVALGAPGLGIALGIGTKFKIGEGISELSVAAILAKAQGLPTKGIEEKIDSLLKRGGGLLQLGSYLGLMSGQKEATVVLNRDGYQYNKDENGQPNFDDLFTRKQIKYNSNLGSKSTTKTETKTETTVKNEPSFAQKKFASLTAAQKAKVGSASQGTASSQAAAEKTAKSYGTDVDNLKGAGNTKYNLSGSGMIAGSNVGATTGGGDYSGVMNKGGLMTSKKKKKKKTKGK